MKIQTPESFTLEDVPTGQFFVRSKTINMSASNSVASPINIDDVLRGI